MKILFNMNSRIYLLLNKLIDLLILNILFILSSLPIITLGASILALNSVSYKLLSDSYSSVVKEYLDAFRKNIKRGVQLFLFFSLLTLSLSVLIQLNSMLSKVHQILGMYGIILFAILIFFTMLYAFPYNSRYTDSFINSIKVSLKISLLNLKRSLTILIFLSGIVTLWLTSNILFVTLSLIFLLLGAPLISYYTCKLIFEVLKKYEGKNYNDKKK